ncbi:MAG: 50S ribosomal protein L11 methyltransferase, partial [Oscillospiraceae bacterium]|nr:50S ribosomal protein L11 methyltransferase [Oscillospiraceae bacterium]
TSIVGVNEEDWANNWKQYYHTQRIGKRIIVTPSWEEYTPAEGEVQMRLDPGMAFGTGTHDTTRLCLELLEEVVTPETRILDVGTGSGILSVGGVLLGAPSALGVDIDPVAVKVANENAEINEVTGKTEFVCGDLTDKVHGKFEIVTANIVADVIIRLLSTVKNYLLKGGVLIVSGIIDTRADEVENACHEAGFVTEKRLEHGGWVAIKLRY